MFLHPAMIMRCVLHITYLDSTTRDTKYVQVQIEGALRPKYMWILLLALCMRQGVAM
jgi:hypothetical protein